MTTMQEINKICLILDSNKNKINILRNFLSKNNIRNNNVINKTNQFINNFERDIDNILSILDNLKFNLKKSGKSLNNDDNNLNFCNNISTTRCCHCCGCFHCCNCYQNYCCDNTNYKTISSNYNNNSNEFKNFENNENINNINDEFKLYQNLNNPNNTYNYNTNPNLNFDYYSLLNNQNNQNNQNNKNQRKNNSKGKIIYSTTISPNKSYHTINKSPSKSYNTINNSPSKNSNLKKKKKAYIQNKNLPNDEEANNINNAIMSSRRFHISKSFNNKRIKILPKNKNINKSKNKNNINRKSPFENKKRKISKKGEIFINKLNKQNDEILSRFKGVYGNDIEQKILNNEVREEDINEMNNILDKIIKMSIWGENNNNNERKMMSSSSNKKRKKYIDYSSDENLPTLRDINNRKITYREFPRGWNSTKEYFINNGTPLF